MRGRVKRKATAQSGLSKGCGERHISILSLRLGISELGMRRWYARIFMDTPQLQASSETTAESFTETLMIRLLFCGFAWGTALGLSWPSTSQAINFVQLFPLGLYMILTGNPGNRTPYWTWAGYLFLTALTLFARPRNRFGVCFSVLVFLLCCNVVGCHMIANNLHD